MGAISNIFQICRYFVTNRSFPIFSRYPLISPYFYFGFLLIYLDLGSPAQINYLTFGINFRTYLSTLVYRKSSSNFVGFFLLSLRFFSQLFFVFSSSNIISLGYNILPLAISTNKFENIFMSFTHQPNTKICGRRHQVHAENCGPHFFSCFLGYIEICVLVDWLAIGFQKVRNAAIFNETNKNLVNIFIDLGILVGKNI